MSEQMKHSIPLLVVGTLLASAYIWRVLHGTSNPDGLHLPANGEVQVKTTSDAPHPLALRERSGREAAKTFEEEPGTSEAVAESMFVIGLHASQATGEIIPWEVVRRARPELLTAELWVTWDGDPIKTLNVAIIELGAIPVRGLGREASPSGGKLVFANGAECPLIPNGENGKTDFIVDVSELLAPLRTTVEFSAYTAQGEAIPLSELFLSRTGEQVHILADVPDPLVEASLAHGAYSVFSVGIHPARGPIYYWGNIQVSPQETSFLIDFGYPHRVTVELPGGRRWLGAFATPQQENGPSFMFPLRPNEHGDWTVEVPDGQYSLSVLASPSEEEGSGTKAGVILYQDFYVAGSDRNLLFRDFLPTLGQVRIHPLELEGILVLDAQEPRLRILAKPVSLRAKEEAFMLPIGTYRIAVLHASGNNVGAEMWGQEFDVIADRTVVVRSPQ